MSDSKCEYCDFDLNDRSMGWVFLTRVNFVKGKKKHCSEYKYAQLAHALTFQDNLDTDYYELRMTIHGLGEYTDGYRSVEVDCCPWCGRDLKAVGA